MENTNNGNEMEAGAEAGIFEKLVKYSLDLHCIIDRAGILLYVSDVSTQILGFPPQQMLGKPLLDFVVHADHEKTVQVGHSILGSASGTSFENCCRHEDGREIPLEWTAFWSEQDAAFFCVGRDATQKKAVARALQEKEELYEALIEHGADMVALMDAQGQYTYVGGPIERILGYKPEELVGRNAFSLIHPEDLEEMLRRLETVLLAEKHINVSGFRFKAASGEWRWIDSHVSNQLQNPSIRALVISSRDITDNQRNKTRLTESEQKYKNLFARNPNPVFHQNNLGMVNEVNEAFCQVLGFTEEAVIGQAVSAFMPPAATLLVERYFQEALRGSTMRFDLEMPAQNGDRKIFDMVMYPLSVNKHIIGVETIAKDITSMVRAYETIQHQAQKLNAVLESITDAFFTLDHDLKFTYVNSELERLLDLNKDKCLGCTIWDVLPQELSQEFHEHYLMLKSTDKAVTFDVFLPGKNVWLGAKFFPAADGISVYLLDITQRVDYQRELQMLSLVASKTTNGVVIMDGNGYIQWVNQGFTNMNGYALEDALGKTPSELLQGPDTDHDASRSIYTKYKLAEPFSAEVLNYKKNGEEFWVKIDVSPVKNKRGQVERYIAIQTDITAQKKSDERQAQLTKDLYRQNRDLQQFTYIVSHNLRAPVANVIGLTRFLTALDKSSPSFQVALQHLEKSASGIDAVLKDLNEILSIGAQRDTVNMESVPLRNICQEALESLHDFYQAFRAQIRIEIPEHIQVYGNRAYLFSVFHNLLSNSIKYRDLERNLEVTIRVERAGPWVAIFFSDNGLGFDEEKAGDKIFKLYKRFHKDIEGRGVGLFLVKTQVDAMGGEIEVSSQENVGTRFLMHLRSGNGG